jgi:hypothetical protein
MTNQTELAAQNYSDYVRDGSTPNEADARSTFMDDFMKVVNSEAVIGSVAVLAATGAAIYLTRGKGGAFRAGAGNLRTLEGTAIPDVARAGLASDALLAGESAFVRSLDVAKRGYADDLAKLYGMPKEVVGMPGETGLTMAERLVRSRSAITSEKVTGELVERELGRVSNLNAGTILRDTDVSGKTVAVWNADDLAKAAGDLQFKHVPQFGQFLKGTGRISEQQIETALQIQRKIPADQPRKLIGDILVENKMATRADVDLAFGRQQEMKTQLRGVFENFLKST